MKILHCCLACFYIDNFSYQENILPRYHKRLGHTVKIVASTESFDKNGNLTYVEAGEYLNEDEIPVVRLPYVTYLPTKMARKLRRYIGLKEQLQVFAPDFIFIHDVQFLDIDIFKDYANQNKVQIVADCHADFSNSARSFLSKYVLHGIVYKHCAKQIEPYVSKFYGVLPARVDFLKTVYKLPPEKCELLVMGAEDDLVNKASKPDVYNAIRAQYGIANDDFLVMTGGKIDAWKTQTLLLMEAVRNITNPKVKLIVFGSVTDDLKERVQTLSDGKKVQYIGWLQSAQSYEYFAMAQLVVFPGRHSVFWEQVTGQGIPMLVKDWPGTHHVDLGGNVEFLKQDSSEEIQEKIEAIVSNPAYYQRMRMVAKEKGMKIFSYKEIARRSIEG